jgi:hypothetical protein
MRDQHSCSKLNRDETFPSILLAQISRIIALKNWRLIINQSVKIVRSDLFIVLECETGVQEEESKRSIIKERSSENLSDRERPASLWIAPAAFIRRDCCRPGVSMARSKSSRSS